MLSHETAKTWCGEFWTTVAKSPPSATDAQPWGSIQHFDVWSFASNDREGGGQQSYFGACPPQIMENLLWFYTDPSRSSW